MPIQLKRDCDVVKRRHNTDIRWQGNAERLKAASGHRFWISTHMLIEDWSGELLEAEAGSPTFIVGVCINVTCALALWRC